MDFVDEVWPFRVDLGIDNLVTGASADSKILAKRTVSLFGFSLSDVSIEQAVQTVLALAQGDSTGHYVVTPNLDHAVLLAQRPELAEVYQSASLVLGDGRPLVWSSHWLRKPLTERVAGSDLVPAVLQAAKRSLKLYLLGARPGVAELAAAKIESKYEHIRVVGYQSPPVGFEHDNELNNRAVRLVAETEPDILILGLGAPKQELWVYRERHRLRAKVAICAGATIDFIAGERRRAPLWCQRYGLEWAYRVIGEPGRLVPRYARDAYWFPKLLLGELRKK